MNWFPAYVGLGSNLDDPPAQLRRAAQALAQLPGALLIRQSSFYDSKPLGTVAQPDFCNAVVGLLTQLPVREFFGQLRALEQQLGRAAPRERWGPRSIDLDLLAYANQRLDEPELKLPHPGLVERNFVLYPLAEVAPDLQLAGVGRVADLARVVSGEGIRLHVGQTQ